MNEDDFINDIRKADWKSVKYDCVNKSVDEFEELFTNIADKHAPMKTKRVRKKQSPWLNDDIIALMRERDRLKKAAIKSGSNASWSAYRSMRNHVNSSIKGVLHPRLVFGLFLLFSQKLQHIGNK